MLPGRSRSLKSEVGKKTQLDFASIIGLLLGPACVLGGQILEGGSLGTRVQLSAAMIVVGATIGDCMLSFPPSSLMAAARDVKKVVASTVPDPFELIDRIVGYSTVLTRRGRSRCRSKSRTRVIRC
jgi:chemotaxis protein MotA